MTDCEALLLCAHADGCVALPGDEIAACSALCAISFGIFAADDPNAQITFALGDCADTTCRPLCGN